ncbi:MAG: PAS domain-containing sensor histidine kinase [Vicinamibacteria bacterium]
METTRARFQPEDALPRSFIVAVLLLTAAPLPLAALGAFSFDSERTGSLVHGLFEWTTLCIALFTAALGLLCSLARPGFLVWIITVAAVSSVVSDTLHAFASMGLVSVASGLEDFVPWTGAVGRTWRAAILTAGAVYLLFFRRERTPSYAGPLALLSALGSVAALALLSQWTHGGLPQTQYPHSIVPRPWELPSLGLFLVDGLLLYALIARGERSLLARVLLLGAIPEVVASGQMAFGSSALYDGPFFMAHSSRLVAVIVPLAGLSLYLVRSYWRENAALRSMESLVRDIEAAENELLSKETLFDQLTQNIQEVFWISDAHGKQMYYVSPAYKEIFGLPVDSLYADPGSFLQVLHPEDRQSMVDVITHHVKREFELDYRIIIPEGHGGSNPAKNEIRWLRTRGFPIRNEAGEVYRLVGITEDVTDRKNAEETVRKSDARTRALLRAMPDLMFRMSRSGVFLDYYAPPTVGLYRPPHTFLGSKIDEVFAGALGERFQKCIEDALSSGIVQTLDYRIPDGCEGEFEARFAPSTEDEVLIVVRDVTEHKQLEKGILEISNREQERIGHDLHDGISQQITGIALLCKALQQQLQSRSRPEAEQAKHIGELLEDTISQTKSLARGLAPVELDAGGLPAALESLAQATERIHGVRCRVRSDRNVPIGSRTEAIHLYRIAQEAVTNAIRHGSPARVSIDLSSNHGRLRLTVIDNGTGIRSEPRHGKGMGLHIMTYRARMIGGSLEVSAGPDRGTIVTCEWSRGAETRNPPLKATSALS